MPSAWIGEVSAAELITDSALASMLGLTTGTVINDSVGWINLLVDGKQLLIAKKCLRYNITASTIHAAKLILGDRTVTIGGKNYIIRCLSKNTTADGPQSYTNDPAFGYGCEWNKIMYRLVNRTGVSGEGIPFGEWHQYAESDLGLTGNANGSRTLTIYSPSSGFSVYRAAGSVLGWSYGTLSGAPAQTGWRPVLEAI